MNRSSPGHAPNPSTISPLNQGLGRLDRALDADEIVSPALHV
ncbi:MAG: hypothetical protein WBE72_20775 [Terracidiphilus sp.]